MKYEKRYKYPHMQPNDVAIWERFIDANREAYEDVDYDVKVGSGAEIPSGTEENIAQGFKTLTQWKIDVVGKDKGRTDIIELKPNATPAALGQVKGYEQLYLEHIDPNATTQAVLITDTLRPDMEKLAKNFGVRLIVI